MATSTTALPPHLPPHRAPCESTFVAQNPTHVPLSWSDWLGHKVVEAVELRAKNKLGAVPHGPLTEPTVAAAAGRWLGGFGRKSLASPPPPWP